MITRIYTNVTSATVDGLTLLIQRGGGTVERQDQPRRHNNVGRDIPR
jgi:hypothetical protein